MKKTWSLTIDLGNLFAGKAPIFFEFIDSDFEVFDEFLDEKYPELSAEIDELLKEYETDESTDTNSEYHAFNDKLIDEFSNTNFYSDEHRQHYIELLGRIGGSPRDPYRKSAAYLMALDNVVYPHAADVFDFDEKLIRPDNFHHGWQTGTSVKTVRLMFNLWNGHSSDGETYKDENGKEQELPSSKYAVDEIFSNAAYAPYYFEAVKIRFEYHF